MSSNAAMATEVPQAPGHIFQGGDEGEREADANRLHIQKKNITQADGHHCEPQI